MLVSKRLLTFGSVALLAACGSSTVVIPPQDVPPLETAVDAGRDVPPPPRDVPAPDRPVNLNPVVVGVVPNHGPFAGGTRAVIRGSNFTEDALVRFGGSLVQPRDTTLRDSHRLEVLTPAARPGPVDVEVEVNGRRSVLPRAFHYDSFYADPSDGSITGGTRITLRGLGTRFTDATTVLVDEAPCGSITVEGPERLSCITAPHPEGRVAITVATGDERITVAEAFTYTDGADSLRGGLGGGPIAGTVNVTILAGGSGAALPNAHVYVGSDPAVPPPRSARTDARGRATLAVPDLRGPITLTAGARCFNSHTVQTFDARNVTLYLFPQMIPACGEGMPPPGGSRGAFGSQISGELVWDGPMEFAPNPWRNIPEARAGERRVAFVFSTQPDILSPPPSPGEGGTVLEVVTPGYGGRGYPFTILSRPASVAVYAIAGIENVRTQRFTPYIMGVARGVLGSPRAMITNVRVDMNIPLDHETVVQLHELPPALRGEPNRIRVEGFLDLGGEGVIARSDITVLGRDDADPYRLVALPAFSGTLADARLTVRAVYGSGEFFSSPFSAVVLAGITTPDDVIHIRNWAGIPDVVAPTEAGRIPDDRRVRFDLRGAAPDMFWVTLTGNVLYWQTFARGSERSFAYPDHSGIMGLADLPASQPLYMNITGLRVPSFDFDQFRYSYLSQLYWTAYSNRALTFQR